MATHPAGVAGTDEEALVAGRVYNAPCDYLALAHALETVLPPCNTTRKLSHASPPMLRLSSALEPAPPPHPALPCSELLSPHQMREPAHKQHLRRHCHCTAGLGSSITSRPHAAHEALRVVTRGPAGGGHAVQFRPASALRLAPRA
jgi:hypothetical protein